MFKYTKHSLKKLESLLEELDYTVRYEKGNFNSGYCIVESRKIAVVNKFFDTEGRINCLLEILGNIEVPPEQLSEASAKFHKQITTLGGEETVEETAEPEPPQEEN
jgi:hypothetical protein